jgi:hypothetical protein
MLMAIRRCGVCACLACGNHFILGLHWHLVAAFSKMLMVGSWRSSQKKIGLSGEVPSRMLKLSRDFVKFLRVLAADRKKYACRMISVLQQCSHHMEVFTCLLRSWRSQFFRVKALRLTLVAVPGNGGFLVVSLLKALFEDWTFFRVKTQDLPLMVRPADDGVCALFPLKASFWSTFFGV